MAIYKLSEILGCIKSMSDDGFEYVNISEIPSDEEYPASLNIEAVIDENSSEEEQIDSVTLPKNYFHLPE